MNTPTMLDILRMRLPPAPFIWIALNLADALITGYAVRHGLTEANWLLMSLADGYGLIVAKYILAGVVLAGLYRFRISKLLLPLNVGLAIIVAWNVAALFTIEA